MPTSFHLRKAIRPPGARVAPRPSPRPGLAALLAASLAALPAAAQDSRPAPVGPGSDDAEVDRLFAELAEPDQTGWRRIEDALALQWSRSGSPAMDLLLQRGRDALEAGDTEAALDHLQALTDHAPDFAEGWNARATAHFRGEDYGLAVAAIARTLALEPRHYPAMVVLATILREVGREADALEVLRRAHALNPHRESVTRDIDALSERLEGAPL